MLFLSGLNLFKNCVHWFINPPNICSVPDDFSPPSSVLLPQGVKDFSVPVDLDAKVKVDLVVVGSVAVSEKGTRQSALTPMTRQPQSTKILQIGPFDWWSLSIHLCICVWSFTYIYNYGRSTVLLDFVVLVITSVKTLRTKIISMLNSYAFRYR